MGAVEITKTLVLHRLHASSLPSVCSVSSVVNPLEKSHA
jgi:hypothetical protein